MQNKIDKLEEKKNELKKKQDEINRKIRLMKSKENAEKKKKETHYKVLLGAYFLNEIINNRIDDDVKRNLKGFIKDEDKYNQIVEFINDSKNNLKKNDKESIIPKNPFL